MAFLDQQTVYPSQKDLAETPGEGLIGLENNVSQNYYRQYQRNSVSGANSWKLTNPASGFDVLLTGDAENEGFAMVRGHRCYMSSTLTLKSAGNDVNVVGNMQANSYNHIYLTINRDFNLEIDRLQITINTSGVVPQQQGNSVKLGVAITNGSVVTSIVDERPSSICQPVFCEIPEKTITSATFVYGNRSFINIPVLGQQTVLAIEFMAGADAGSAGPAAVPFEWKCEVEGPGPDGLGLIQESAVHAFTTTKSGSINATTVHKGFILIENEIGRFGGSMLKIRMAGKPTGGSVQLLISTYNVQSSINFDSRGGHRIQNWAAQG